MDIWERAIQETEDRRQELFDRNQRAFLQELHTLGFGYKHTYKLHHVNGYAYWFRCEVCHNVEYVTKDDFWKGGVKPWQLRYTPIRWTPSESSETERSSTEMWERANPSRQLPTMSKESLQETSTSSQQLRNATLVTGKRSSRTSAFLKRLRTRQSRGS